MIWSSNCWIRSSGEADAEEEVRSQEVEEENFCWVWRAKLTILVVLRKIFLLADLLIVAEIWLTQCFIIFWTFDFLTSPSTNCNLSLICWRKRFLILSPISPVVEQTAARKTRPLAVATVPYFDIFCFSHEMTTCWGLLLWVRVVPSKVRFGLYLSKIV